MFQPNISSADWVTRARSADIVALARKFQPSLKRVGAEWAGPCPAGCAQHDGFAVDPRKGVFICRPSKAGGDVIAMAMHALGCGFNDACTFITGQARHDVKTLTFSERLEAQKRQTQVSEEIERSRQCKTDADASERKNKRHAASLIWEESQGLSGNARRDLFRRPRRFRGAVDCNSLQPKYGALGGRRRMHAFHNCPRHL